MARNSKAWRPELVQGLAGRPRRQRLRPPSGTRRSRDRAPRIAWRCCSASPYLLPALRGTAGQTGAPAAGPEALLGIWVPDAAPRALLTSKGKTPPLTAEASKLYTERRQRLAKGDASFDPTTWCAGPGMPRILTMPYPLEIRADANRIAFIHGWYRWFRIVDLGAGTAGSAAAAHDGFSGRALGGQHSRDTHRRIDRHDGDGCVGPAAFRAADADRASARVARRPARGSHHHR